MIWYTFIDVRLVYNLGYELRQAVNQWRIGGRYLCAVNGVCGAVFDQQREESEDAVHEKGDDEGVYKEKDGETATHGLGSLSSTR